MAPQNVASIKIPLKLDFGDDSGFNGCFFDLHSLMEEYNPVAIKYPSATP